MRLLLNISHLALGFIAALSSLPVTAQDNTRPRIRDLGVAPGIFQPGPLNAITDVSGVRVGHRTLIRGGDVRTGVTAIVPHEGNLFQQKLPAAVHVANAFGKAAGLLQIQELGTLETPIVLTNTLSVGTALDAVVSWTLQQPGNETVRSVNAVAGETNDGYLNDIRGRHVTHRDVLDAIERAAGGPVPEGSVGAGTGAICLGWKGGIGTASRRLPETLGGYTVGALVQSNYGGILTIDGIKVGQKLGNHAFQAHVAPQSEVRQPEIPRQSPGSDGPEEGSVMVVLATDAPLDARNLERLARRAPLGLARTGSHIANGSGDFVIAFSTAYRIPHRDSAREHTVQILYNDAMSPLFLATVEAVEEAVYNSLLRATTVTGHRGTVEAIPLEELRSILADPGQAQ